MRAQGRNLMALAAAALLAGGCAHGSGPAALGEPGDEERTAVVEVANNHWSDVNVYLLVGGLRHRLGTVTSFAGQAFRVAAGLLRPGSDLRLVADPIGSTQQYVSPQVLVNPGQRVEWKLENNLNLSSVAVR